MISYLKAVRVIWFAFLAYKEKLFLTFGIWICGASSIPTVVTICPWQSKLLGNYILNYCAIV